MAYHVGAKNYTPEALGRLGHYPNNCTVGIELCHPKADGAFTPDSFLPGRENGLTVNKSLCMFMPSSIASVRGADIIIRFNVNPRQFLVC
jgi:hypothetical protein